MKTTMTVAVGMVLLSGNSLYPEQDKVLRIETWAQLSADEQRVVRTIEYWKTEDDFAAREYVRYATRGRRGDPRVTPREVFEATRFETHDAMIAAYRKA